MQTQKNGLVLIMSLIFSMIFSLIFSLGPSLAKALPLKDALQVTVDKNLGEVTFIAMGTHAIHIEGKGDGPGGTLQLKAQGPNILISGSLVFLIDSLKTGIAMRDRHMKEKYLESSKYSEARLTLKDFSTPQDILTDSDKSLAFTGTLSLHGVEKEVKGQMNTHKESSDLSIDTKFKIKLTDFGIVAPSFAGITVADDIEVQVKFKAPVHAL